MSAAVRLEGVSKQYRRGGAATSLREDLLRARDRMFGRPRQQRGKIALEDVSFTIPQGASLALIGPNGAGKSTALKLVARISYPTGGRIWINGRVGALMEVGSGIHPELSGRENVWLYGSILGIPRQEIARRFDDIVDFAELGGAIDTQVKYYSSGMQLRLGFAVASFLEPDVFLVDEALAVGDASFQTRCVDRMRGMVGEGRTLVFVSHSLPLVQQLCTSAVLLDHGRLITEGAPADVITTYTTRLTGDTVHDAHPDDWAAVRSFAVETDDGAAVRTGSRVSLRIDLDVATEMPDAVVGMSISDGRPGNLVAFTMLSTGEQARLPAGQCTVSCHTDPLPLLPGTYDVWFAVTSRNRLARYVDPRFVGTLLVRDGPPEVSLQPDFAQTSGFGPVYVPFRFGVEER
jgi:ABC-type polysaccharide/polyol phosphate transport system ATPase subunit